MNRFMRFCLLLLLSFSALVTTAFGKTGIFEQIQTTPVHELENPYLAETKDFYGQFCFRKDLFTDCGSLAEIQASHKIKFFYPDLNTEVTEFVSLEELDEVEFSYTAAIPAEGPAPVFYVVVELLEEDLITNVAQEKALQAQIAAAGSNPPTGLIQQLNAVRALLKENYPAAVYEWPYAKRGLTNPPLKYTTHNRNYRLQIQLDRSDYFPGESGKVTYSLKSLRPGAQPQDIYYLGIDGVETFSSNVKTNSFDIAASFGPPSPEGNNLRVLEFRTSKAGRTFHPSTVPFSFEIPFMQASTVPELVYSHIIPIGQKIVVDVSKQIERFNLQRFQSEIIRYDEEYLEVEVPSKIASISGKLTIPKNGISGAAGLSIESISDQLPDGQYEVRIYGTDFNGDDIYSVANIVIDSTPPEIILPFPSGYITNQANFEAQLGSNDLIPLMLRILKNGVEVGGYFANSWDFSHTLDEGPNTFTLEATDDLGRVTTKEWFIILDSEGN